MSTTFDRLQERYDNQLPVEATEPSEEHFNKAFDQLMQDDELLIEYIDEEGPDTTTIFQIIHRMGGLPLNFNGNERFEVMHDQLTGTAEAFIEGYREWLGDRLAERAEQVRLQAIDEARLEAEEARADNSLNGGW